MKVLLISNHIPNIYSGIERHCYNIIKLFKGDKDIIIDTISKENVKHYYLKFIRKYVFSYNDLKKKIMQSECDVVHIHGFALPIVWQSLFVSHKLKKRIIYTAHFHPFDKLNNPLLGKLFFYTLIRPCLKYVDTIISINKEDTAFFRKYHNNVVMIPNWLSFSDFPTNIKKEKNMILFVGRNDSNKSPNYLLNLPRKYIVHCVTNSKAGLREDFVYHNMISDDELSNLYSQASLLVAPSRYEAFSYVVLESLLHGTPVLVSDNVRIVDYLDNINGVTVFKYGSNDDFISKVEIAISQKVPVNKVKEIFSEDKIKEKLKNIYSYNN